MQFETTESAPWWSLKLDSQAVFTLYLVLKISSHYQTVNQGDDKTTPKSSRIMMHVSRSLSEDDTYINQLSQIYVQPWVSSQHVLQFFLQRY